MSPGQFCCRYATPRNRLRPKGMGGDEPAVEARRLRHETTGFQRFFFVGGGGRDKRGRRLTETQGALGQ